MTLDEHDVRVEQEGTHEAGKVIGSHVGDVAVEKDDDVADRYVHTSPHGPTLAIPVDGKDASTGAGGFGHGGVG